MMSAEGDELLIADAHNGAVRRFDPRASMLSTTMPGRGIGGAASISVAAPMPGEGRRVEVFIADAREGAIERLDPEPGERTRVVIEGL